MEQGQTQVQQVSLRELSVMEVVSLAYHLWRKRGKESRRVTLFLKPSMIPPKSGIYSTPLGEVKIKATFQVAEGRWLVNVTLPPREEGFKVQDYVRQT
jgi:hypothetical protein